LADLLKPSCLSRRFANSPAHCYFFKLYALDTALELETGVSRRGVEKAMTGHILASGQLVGRYGT